MLPVGRTVPREWMPRYRGLNAVGHTTVAMATDTIPRLSRPTPGGTEAVLSNVKRIAERPAIAAPAPVPPAQGQFDALAGRIDRQRDETMRAGIILTSDRARFAAAEAALVDVLDVAADADAQAARRRSRTGRTLAGQRRAGPDRLFATELGAIPNLIVIARANQVLGRIGALLDVPAISLPLDSTPNLNKRQITEGGCPGAVYATIHHKVHPFAPSKFFTDHVLVG